ncbi:MAG TPA: SDR family oxidoreductase [bacterium]|nr:SDR family oxidoreductase [bacterium]
MRIGLEGQRAVVTGSTAGIGFAIAAGLAGAGATVVLNGRHARSVEEAAERIREHVPAARVRGIAADLSRPAETADFIARAGEADILVNNVATFQEQRFEDIRDEDWLRYFQTNVMSGTRLSRHYLPRMLKGNWGRIVFISSESAINVPKEMIHYGVTKAAQLAVSRGLAELTAGSAVTVNAVLPGPTRTEGVAAGFKASSEKMGVAQDELERQYMAKRRATSLLRRLETPEEVANLVVFVCSREASAINGAALRVDGGVVRSIV